MLNVPTTRRPSPSTEGIVVELWINPACSKCRVALDALDEAGTSYTVRRYLDVPPTITELETVLDRLGLEPWDITRTQEPIAHEIGLRTLGRTTADRNAWLTALAEHPILIQRPIITADDGTAVIARDEKALRGILHAT